MNSLKLHLTEGLETFKDLFDHAHDLIHIVEPGGNIIYVNNAWKKHLGYSQDEIEGRSIFDFVDPQDREAFEKYRKNVVQNNISDKEIVVALVAKDGKKLYVEGIVSLKMKDGKPFYTRGIFRDITARLQNEARLKELNEELKEREANLQQLLANAPDAIVVINEWSVITYWNPKAEQIFGWSYQEAVGRTLGDTIIPPQYKEAHENGMRRYLTTREARVLNKTTELTALDKAGREFYISLTVSAVVQAGSRSFIAFIRDIDQQKRNETELERKRAELEFSNQELEQFAHVASHDMKEPVRKIRLFADQLKRETLHTLPDKAKTFLDKIELSAARLSKMVDGVLAHSSVSSAEPAHDRIDLNEVIASIESDLELIVQQTGALVKYHDLPPVKGSPFLIYQLFYNLLNNSLKFSRPGVPPIIRITARPEGSFVQVTISDNGIGFSKTDAEKIFKRFSRLHSITEYEGTGLGLSLCKNIVERHGGMIYAEGEEGKGSVFTISLPAWDPVDQSN